MTGFLNALNAWLAEPFQSSNNAWQWILFVGLIIIAAFLWHLVLLHIIEGAKEL